MQKASPEYTLLILSISSPLLIGVYQNGKLIETVKSSKKISEILLDLVAGFLKKYPVSNIVYTRGPGSYMSIKLTYIILKTIEIVEKIPFSGCSAFAVNGGRPVKAIGKLYFVKEGNIVKTEKFDNPVPQIYELPESLENLPIDEEAIPDYMMPAVQGQKATTVC